MPRWKLRRARGAQLRVCPVSWRARVSFERADASRPVGYPPRHQVDPRGGCRGCLALRPLTLPALARSNSLLLMTASPSAAPLLIACRN